MRILIPTIGIAKKLDSLISFHFYQSKFITFTCDLFPAGNGATASVSRGQVNSITETAM